LDLPQRINDLKDSGFNQVECNQILESLRTLTNNIIHSDQGLWKKDIAKLDELKRRHEIISSSKLHPIDKIYWLLEDCKRYGTLPFAGLARAGFIAIQLLQSLVRVEVLSASDYQNFMESLNTVSSDMQNELNNSKEIFLKEYGHLRPGTYNILSDRYDESPDMYFDWGQSHDSNKIIKPSAQFSLNLDAMNRLENMLKEHGLNHNVLSLFDFIKGAIEGREYAKFIFTKSLSDAMSLIKTFGNDLGINKEDLSYVDIGTIKKLYSSSDDAKERLLDSVECGKAMHKKACSITLPPLITSESDIRFFELPSNRPNYITLKSIRGNVVFEDCEKDDLAGNILMIKSADPGYDWIFSRGIGGFITMYGGANSHMAIRAAELGIPAVIGAGDVLFKQWCTWDKLEIDCANRKVNTIK